MNESVEVSDNESPVDRAITLLEEDHERQGYLTLDDVLSIVARLELGAEEEIAVCRGLAQRGVHVNEKEQKVRDEVFPVLGKYSTVASKRLSPDAVAELSRVVQAGLKAAEALTNGNCAELEELRRIEVRGREARIRIMEANLGLVGFVARDYVHMKSLTREDLMQEGVIGLHRAVERFDPTVGTQFSTYAMFWIRHAIRRAISDKDRTIRMPVWAQDLLYRVRRTQKALTTERGGAPVSLSEVAEQLREDPAKLQFIQDMSKVPLALDGPASNDSDDLRSSTIADSKPAPEELLLARERAVAARDAIEWLSKKEGKILSMRCGLDGEEERTLEEIGQIYRLSRERIRQLQEQALGRLRHPTPRNPLQDFIDGYVRTANNVKDEDRRK